MFNFFKSIPWIILLLYGSFCAHFALFGDGTTFEKLMVLGMFLVVNTLHSILEFYWSE